MHSKFASLCRTLFLGAVLATMSAAPAAGQVALPAAPVVHRPLTPRVGVTIVDLGSGETGTPAVELTQLADQPLFWRVLAGAGLTASFRGAVYGYAGLHLPLDLPGGLVARPSVSFGLYEGGGGMDLGHPLEFRSGIVMERPVADRVVVSALLYHMSNAGLGRRNPGMEGLGLGVTLLSGGRSELASR